MAEEEVGEERRRRGRPRIKPPKPEEELVRIAEYFDVLRREISTTVALALEPVQRIIESALGSVTFIIDDSVQRATAPATEAVIQLLPTLVPTVIESLRDSLTKMPDVSYSACTAFIPDVCTTQCGELATISPELPTECYRKCEESIKELCRTGTESVKAFIERQLERIESLVEGIVSFAPIVATDVPQISDSTAIVVRRR